MTFGTHLVLHKVSAKCFASKDSPKKVRHVRRRCPPLHDNARSHASRAVSEILEKYGWQVLPHPPYSPDMSPPDFDLFPRLKKPLRGERFSSIEEVSNEVTRVIRHINK